MSHVAPTIDSGEVYFTAAEVVEYCREVRNLKTITEGTIRRATYEGRKPLVSSKIGGRIHYARSDVDRWLAACKQV